ncbi:hypothetical protein ACMXZI_17495 [Bacillus subtilis]|uniref:hypothetical protein n=2 Tax=Bacillaceae TaxID=186817 RepID=UPI0001F5BEAD|nr:hypothetical protein [Bacillus]ADV95588.1 hypothetical protein BSn5_14900 [Bacillus subtilis BSn5]AOS66809.1 hypothetical protein A4A60_03625 [Bacillus subtilis]ARW30308.1 hypothetical protein S101441_00738 [Bacillus subtilis subsp. subtilis]ASV03480.1 hypothetical protein CJZ71_15820 [Bacillus subtilis]AYK55911.1 hypothetical protein D9C10_01150 [Bacillus subtilis subsp. subtilis]
MIPSSKAELDKIKKDCLKMVNKRATASGLAGAIPVPGVDVGTDVAIMMELIPKINRKFGLSEEQIEQLDVESKKMILVLATSIGSEMIGKMISKKTITTLLKKIGLKKIATKSTAKFIPVVGQVASGSISFFAMKSLGKSHIEDCYNVCLNYINQKELSL